MLTVRPANGERPGSMAGDRPRGRTPLRSDAGLQRARPARASARGTALVVTEPEIVLGACLLLPRRRPSRNPLARGQGFPPTTRNWLHAAPKHPGSMADGRHSRGDLRDVNFWRLRGAASVRVPRLRASWHGTTSARWQRTRSLCFACDSSGQTLKRISVTSPSRIRYSLPSDRSLATLRASANEPSLIKSSYSTISARMKPRARSE